MCNRFYSAPCIFFNEIFDQFKCVLQKSMTENRLCQHTSCSALLPLAKVYNSLGFRRCKRAFSWQCAWYPPGDLERANKTRDGECWRGWMWTGLGWRAEDVRSIWAGWRRNILSWQWLAPHAPSRRTNPPKLEPIPGACGRRRTSTSRGRLLCVLQ